MVFDRISLIAIYDVLKTINENDGRVTGILMNRSSRYGTKTAQRIESVQELHDFIEANYPYVVWNEECECPTCNEGIYHLLAFSVYLKDQRHAIFVNNLRSSFESAKENQLNGLSVKKCANLFRIDSILQTLKDTYVCFPYITQQGVYVNPCEYIEVVRNEAYYKLIDQHYRLTKRPEFPRTVMYNTLDCAG
jgi:hypothetical protein